MGAPQRPQRFGGFLQPDEGCGRSERRVGFGRPCRVTPRFDRSCAVDVCRLSGDFGRDRGCALHRLRTELSGAHVFRAAFRCRERRLAARCFGQARRVIVRVQCTGDPSLLILVFREDVSAEAFASGQTTAMGPLKFASYSEDPSCLRIAPRRRYQQIQNIAHPAAVGVRSLYRCSWSRRSERNFRILFEANEDVDRDLICTGSSEVPTADVPWTHMHGPHMNGDRW